MKWGHLWKEGLTGSSWNFPFTVIVNWKQFSIPGESSETGEGWNTQRWWFPSHSYLTFLFGLCRHLMSFGEWLDYSSISSGGDSNCSCCPRYSMFTGATQYSTEYVSIDLDTAFFSKPTCEDRQTSFSLPGKAKNTPSQSCFRAKSVLLPLYSPQIMWSSWHSTKHHTGALHWWQAYCFWWTGGSKNNIREWKGGK